MLIGKRIVVVLPAYNAAKTLRATVAGVPPGIVDEFILVDDASDDGTEALSRELGLTTIRHPRNLGYGANQKTCYAAGLASGADVIVMLHPDYQYSPALVPAIAWLVACGDYDVALGSRILGGGAMRGGMPVYKYVANRALTFIQNLATGAKLSEYHTGFRAFSREVLETVPFERNSDDFIFDNQILNQVLGCGFRIGEISCPAKYFAEASSINFSRSLKYGCGVLIEAARFLTR
ncbi:MAG: glycosyltransferase family 2 protein [Vicinamibacteria bacterium]|nr:glycosyltransferase family 2 protein [Vicinamibacteria bacterium]MBP9948078.1 glycosyltransferase family 2 protein [Vicinamibacteria bacterium]